MDQPICNICGQPFDPEEGYVDEEAYLYLCKECMQIVTAAAEDQYKLYRAHGEEREIPTILAEFVADEFKTCDWCGGPIRPKERYYYEPVEEKFQCERCYDQDAEFMLEAEPPIEETGAGHLGINPRCPAPSYAEPFPGGRWLWPGAGYLRLDRPRP